jgi:hypothetical protein
MPAPFLWSIARRRSNGYAEIQMFPRSCSSAEMERFPRHECCFAPCGVDLEVPAPRSSFAHAIKTLLSRSYSEQGYVNQTGGDYVADFALLLGHLSVLV